MYKLSKLSDALNEIMVLRDLTEKALSENTGIPVSCISLYLRGMQAPYTDTLIKLADYFHCSVDYILGLTDICEEKIYKPCPPFPERLEHLLTFYNKTSKQILDKTAISKSSFYEWKRGKSLPTLENLVKLSEFFDCSVDFILGRET